MKFSSGANRAKTGRASVFAWNCGIAGIASVVRPFRGMIGDVKIGLGRRFSDVGGPPRTVTNRHITGPVGQLTVAKSPPRREMVFPTAVFFATSPHVDALLLKSCNMARAAMGA